MTDVPMDAKIRLTGGRDFWHTHPVPEADLPSVMLTDGPHGVRMQPGGGDHVGLGSSAPATCFPPAVGLAATWNPDLLESVGAALGDEARSLGVGVLLGPGINIKRDPRCGRNFEYFSEDPFLTGELATRFVRGVQSRGVGTSLKHFAANNQETDRMRRSSDVDERPLREIYLRAFQKVVTQAQPWTVMCSYNKLNGVQASENRWLLTDVLRGEWGFEGLVVSDWGAVWDRVAALKAGLDLEMPANAAHEAATAAALAAGQIDPETIDTAYRRIETVMARAAATVAQSEPGFDVDAHHALARTAAEQAIVLLTNDGVLPLPTTAKVAVVGEFARTPRYQGAGSSRVNPTRLDSALDAIEALTGGPVPFAPGFATHDGQELPDTAVDDAIAVARDAEVVLVFLGLGENHESEGYDRDTLDLPADQLAVLDAVTAVNPNVVVVLSNGASVLVPFADRVRAVVEGWLLGQAGGLALADVLYGVVNPSGRITETIPHQLTDVPSYLSFPGDADGVRYGEGLFVGYRGYDKLARPVAFPFGHGLSYTTFSYSDVAVTADGDQLTVTLTVTNTGDRAGREIVQVYVGVPGSHVTRAPRELKGFASVDLAAGSSVPVTIAITADDLASWSVRDQAWLVEGGDYRVEVGSSSGDIRHATSVAVAGNEPVRPLTLASTMAEAMADAEFGARMQELLAQSFGDLAGDSSLGTDSARMMADFPLAGLMGFSGQDPVAFQQLLDEVNAARGISPAQP